MKGEQTLALSQLKSLLTFITLESGGTPVEVDGLLPDGLRPCRPDGPDYQFLPAVSRHHAPIRLVADQLRSIFRSFSPVSQGMAVPVDGFRLKHLEDWRCSADIEPGVVEPSYSIIPYLAHPCGHDCPFCLHKGDPPGYFTRGRWRTSMAEIRTRLRLYKPDEQTALFATADYPSYEVLTHPSLMEVLGEIRKKTDRAIAIVTSGGALSERMIDRLTDFMPLLLVVSLNAAAPAQRRTLMRDPDPEVAVGSLRLLRERKIPFYVSLTPDFGADVAGIREAALFADQFSPYLIRLNLSGRTRYHPPVPADPRILWDAVVELASDLRPLIRAPVRIQPAMYEENRLFADPLAPYVSGAVIGSPAQAAGVSAGDLIIAIEGRAVKNRQTAKDFVRSRARQKLPCELTLTGDRGLFTVRLEPPGTGYPHTALPIDAVGAYPYGIVLVDSLRPSYWRHLGELAHWRSAKNVLLITSELMEPSVRRMQEHIPHDGIDIGLAIPGHSSFLGGDLCVGDLSVTEDIVQAVARYSRDCGRPDLVVVPSSVFSAWGRDLTGTPYSRIERQTGIPVELLRCHRIAATG